MESTGVFSINYEFFVKLQIQSTLRTNRLVIYLEYDTGTQKLTPTSRGA